MANILVKVSELVDSNPQIKEMDINPLIITKSGAIAADARIVLNKSKKSDFAEAHYALGMAYLRMNNKAMALKPISMLRSLNKEDLAMRIEVVMSGRAETFKEEVPIDEYNADVSDSEFPSILDGDSPIY